MFSHTGHFLQARAAVALGEDISRAHKRGFSMEKTFIAHVPGHCKAEAAPLCPEWAGEK